jgi:hypothetical protein
MTTATAPADASHLLKASVINGAINAVINGAIQFFMLRGHGPVALTADAISTTEHTVLGSAVPLAVMLAMILTAVTHLTIKGPKPPFFPGVFWLTLKHGFFAFGVVVSRRPFSGSGRGHRRCVGRKRGRHPRHHRRAGRGGGPLHDHPCRDGGPSVTGVP